jgi:biopolymer transport protein ExbD
MAISAGGGSEDKPMSDINTTPLVDVMLVLLIIFLIAIPVAIQSIEKLKIPVFPSVESKDKVENLQITVSSTDASGISPAAPGMPSHGFAGAARQGECRVFFNNIVPVDSSDLLKQASKRLQDQVDRAGGPEAMLSNPELIPQVHIRGDENVAWRCVAGVVYTVQLAGYPTVGFISNPVDPNS